MDQQSLRKAFGALKDSTTVGLAKVNSDYKELDVAIVKATNHVEMLAKEKHMHKIFDAISSSRPRADVAYSINALGRRLAKTHNWAVAVKTLIVIHRAMREVDATFREELLNYCRSKGYILNLSHFKDESSPNAWDYSAWVRTYALYLEELLECLHVLKYDVVTEPSKTSELDTVELLEHLPALQQLLSRLTGCQPQRTVIHNTVIRYVLSLIAKESIKIYNAMNGCTLNLADKFFEMQHHDVLRALDIYRNAGRQAEWLSEFYEVCKGLDLGREQNFVKIEQPPASFIAAMEEYVKNASHSQATNPRVVDADRRLPAPKPIMAIEHKKVNSDDKEPELTRAVSLPQEPIGAEATKAPLPVQTQVSDLLGLDDCSEEITKLEENNALALAIVSDNSTSTNTGSVDLSSGATGWELALVSAPSSNESTVAESYLGGGLDKLTLDSLYDNAISRRANPNANYHLPQMAPNPFGASQFSQDPFYASHNIAPPPNIQMSSMAQQQAFMYQGHSSTNPFGNPFESTGVSSYPHTGLI